MTTVLHVGLPKTGTTMLQRHVFPALDGVEVHVDRGAANDPLMRRLIAAEKEEDRGTIPPARGPRLISRENFTFPRKTDVAAAPGRLRALIGAARVVIAVRRQADWLESMYFQDQSVAKTRRRGLMETPRDWLARALAGPILGQTRFAALADRWADAFGAENVALVPFEQLRRDPAAFFAPFAAPLGRDPQAFVRAYAAAPATNARLEASEFFAGLATSDLRRRAPVTFRLMRMAGRSLGADWEPFGMPARFDFAPLVPPGIARDWAEQNAEVARRFGLPLGDLGYAVA